MDTINLSANLSFLFLISNSEFVLHHPTLSICMSSKKTIFYKWPPD